MIQLVAMALMVLPSMRKYQTDSGLKNVNILGS